MKSWFYSQVSPSLLDPRGVTVFVPCLVPFSRKELMQRDVHQRSQTDPSVLLLHIRSCCFLPFYTPDSKHQLQEIFGQLIITRDSAFFRTQLTLKALLHGQLLKRPPPCDSHSTLVPLHLPGRDAKDSPHSALCFVSWHTNPLLFHKSNLSPTQVHCPSEGKGQAAYSPLSLSQTSPIASQMRGRNCHGQSRNF